MFKISYRTLRYIASISVGALAMIGVFAFMWAFTNCNLAAILFWCLIAYSIGISIVWSISEPKPSNRRDVPFVNIKEGKDGYSSRRK